jgi:glycosyltransferase involved in cell wall biosynthesis
MPRVSVVIGSYNHERYVGETIQSVLDQTYQDFEIVITDDGSQDGTVNEIRKFTDPRITLTVFEKNKGACIAFNTSIAKSQGEYIAVLNSDDAFKPEKLEKQVRFLDEHREIGAVFTNAMIIDDNGNNIDNRQNPYSYISKHRNKTRHEWLRHFFYLGSSPCHPSVLIRKECYKTVGLYDPRLGQIPDVDFWIRLCMKYNIHILPEKLVKFRYRDNAANQSGNKPEKGIRMYYERKHVLRNYLCLKARDEFLAVFPEAEQLFSPVTEELIPFYLSQLSMRIKTPPYRLFALDTLFDILDNSQKRKLIEEKHNYAYVDFFKDTADYDIFSLYAHGYSYILVDTGDGYAEGTKILQPVNVRSSAFFVTFDLSDFSRVRSLRWDPTRNYFCKITIYRITYKEKSGKVSQLDINSLRSNGKVKGEGTVIFKTAYPKFFLPISGDIASVEIAGSWSCVDPISYLYNSKSWKLTAPLRAAAHFFRSLRSGKKAG